MARDLLKAGARVALLGRTRSKLEELQRKLAEEGLTRTLVIAADVLDKAQLEEAATLLENTWGRLDILVNGAGGNDPRGTTPAGSACRTPRWSRASSAWTCRVLSTSTAST